MRIRMVLGKNGRASIPFNYNQFLHAIVLEKINCADPEYAKELHDGTGFKFFTFSEIFIPRGRADREKETLEVFSGSVSLFVSSPSERFLRAFLNGVLSSPQVRIGTASFGLESAVAEPAPDFSSGKAVFRTISPLVVSTMREMDGKTRSWDILPQDLQFYDNVKNNLVRKFSEFHGRPPKGDALGLKVTNTLRTRRIRVKEEYHVGSKMEFEAAGEPELLSFAYECGFGERNSMGFGMVGVVG